MGKHPILDRNVGRLAVLLAASLLLVACGSKDLSSLPSLATAPAPAPIPVTGKYTIQIGDVLDIKFPLNPELNETVTVRPDGMFSTSIAADLPAYNLTTSEIDSELREAYRKELQDPRVSTVVRSFSPTRIYVSGEVASPGEFIVVGAPLTLTQAIARAGGTLNSAKATQVLILRRGAGDKSQAFLANYEGATQNGEAQDDLRLAPYDVVFVPKTDAALAHKFYQQHLQQFVAPSVGASYSLND